MPIMIPSSFSLSTRLLDQRLLIRLHSWQSVIYFSSSRPLSLSSSSNKVTGPTQSLKAWERGAKLVKNVQVENQYLEHIRQIHDPSMQLKTIEDELKGTIGRALGKQGEKVNMYLRAMEQEKRALRQMLDEGQKDYRDKEVTKVIERFNSFRRDAVQARWELIVHRQAVGFTVDNQRFIMTKFPIEDALPTADEEEDAVRQKNDPHSKQQEVRKKEVKQLKKFGDQLDWWQKVGRWR